MRKHRFSSQGAFLGLIFLMLLTVSSASATVYYVSTDGDDAADGLSVATAWKTIDNGDSQGLLLPGDTVYILPGTYLRVATTVLFTTDGAPGQPIVYLKHGATRPVVNLGNAGRPGITITGKHTVLDGIEVTLAKDGILLDADSCEINHCLIWSVAGNGIKVQSSDNLIYRNIIYLAGDRGIKNEDAGEFRNLYYHNVISASDDNGIELGSKAKTARIFNNIITQNGNKGIKGPVEAICGFNNVWGNPGGNYDGVVDSAGGISKAPKFISPAANRFDLQDIASEIDAGLDIGLHFNGPAPDMGAVEKYNVYYVSPTGNDSASGHAPQVAWLTIDNGDSLLLPGDTVHVASGTYNDSVVFSDNGFDVSDRIVILGTPESTFVDASLFSQGITVSGSFVTLSGFNITDAQLDNFRITGGNVTLDQCWMEDAGVYGINTALPLTLERSVISGSGTAGVHCDSGTGGFIYNNTFYQNGSFAYESFGTGATFVNNIFQGHTAAAVRADVTTSLTYSIFHNNTANVQGGVAPGTGTLNADPYLIDPAGGNYRIESRSPAMDAGDDVGLPYVDPAPDLGAYEAENAVTISVQPPYDTLRADSTYPFDVHGYDAEGQVARTGPITWSHTFSDGSISSEGVFTPQSIGTGAVIAEAPEFGLTDTSAVMVVVAGALAQLSVSPLQDTVSADTTRLFTAAGLDIRGNAVADLGTLTWQVLGDIGWIDNSGLFTPTAVGKGVIRVSSDYGVIGQSDTIVVVAGALSALQVLPEENIQGHSEAFQYHAYAYDADSNLVGEVTDSASWSITDPSGSITAGGLYTTNPSTDGTYYVIAEYSGQRDSAEVIVTNQLSKLRVEFADGTPIGDLNLTTDDDTTRMYCRAYTAADVLIGDVAVSWTVLGTDSIGVVSNAFGPMTTLELTAPGTGQVVALDSLGRTDTTGIITCTAGLPDHFLVLPATDTVSADSTLTFVCQSLDADGNPSEPGVVPTWFVLGGIGTIDAGGVFTPTATGTGQIVCLGGGIADTVGPISVVAGALSQIEIAPDSAVISADGGMPYTVLGRDSQGNVTDAGDITWGVVDPLGTIDSTGYFDAVTTGITRVTAVSSLGPVDTSAYLQILPGIVTSLEIGPDSIAVTTDSVVTFVATGFDADGNTTSAGQLNWTVVGDIGDISSGGVFTPLVTGTGQIAVYNAIQDVSDTNALVTVLPGGLARLAIAPDTAILKVGESRPFTAIGYDMSFNLTDVGLLTWSVSGGIGSIDDSGLFTASAPGQGRIIAQSNATGVTDSTGVITVEALDVSTIPLGTTTVPPGSEAAILIFRIGNAFATDKEVSQIEVHTAFRGPGSPAQRWSNLTGLALYLDNDGDSVFSAGDSLMAEIPVDDSIVTFTFAPISIAGYSGRDFIVTGRLALSARDADTLDLVAHPDHDFVTVDGTTVVGPDSINSLGYTIIDGMVAAQIPVTPTGISALVPADSLYNVLTFDLPRNGYMPDTFSTISVYNLGTALYSDFAQMTLYADNGDGVWGGAGDEIALGNLGYTGALWVRSGLSYPLTAVATHFYVALRLVDFPTGGATVALSIPTGGVIVRSTNDGPIDVAVNPADTIPIVTFESITLTGATITPHPVTPGEATGPMFGMRLSSSYGAPAQLDSFALALTASDPRGATPAQLAGQVDSVLLYLNRDGSFGTFGSSDSLIAVGTLSDGVVRFAPTNLMVPGDGGSIELSVGLHLTATARNGNTFTIALADSTDMWWGSSLTVDGTFPLGQAGPFTVNAFSAGQVAVNPVDGATLFGGQTNSVVLDIVLPPNGYALDSLKSMRIHNIGSFVGTNDILTFKLWAERAVDGFTADDSLIGTFLPSNGGWLLDGLRYPISLAGLRCYVTVSVASVSFNAGTIRMEVPSEQIKYVSGTDGPNDVGVSNPNVHLIVPSNRITAISVPSSSAPVAPGASENTVLTFALYNGYVGHDQTLKSTALTNISRSRSGLDYADYEFGQVSLYYDSDNNRTLDNDSLVAVGSFADGRLLLSGFDVLLPAESLTYFFVVADLRFDAIDSDSLSIAVTGPSDFGFSEPVSINGDMPLSGGGYLIVDGSVRSQYQILPQAPRTLSPLDSGVTLMAILPAANGNLTDTLQSVSITNVGSATTADLDRLALWLDLNADRIWQDTDSLLGTMTFGGTAWTLNGLQVPITQNRPALFVVADIAAAASPDASFQGEIPINGCLYSSANDGPRDSVLLDHNVYTISNSSLQVAYTPLFPAYSVGQTIPVQFSVTNISDSTIDGVTGAVVDIADSALVTMVGGSPTPVTLAPDQTTLFTFTYAAAAVGEESWQLAAFSAADTSSVVATNTTTLQQPPSFARARLGTSIPTAVTRGQENVFPLSLIFTHPDTALATGSLRLDSLLLTVENGSGAGINADDVFSRLSLSTGSATLTVIDSVPTSSTITVHFDQPLLVQPGGEQRLSVLVDIDSAAIAPQFALAVVSATSLPFLDANSSELLSVTSPTGFPMRTATCRIDDPSQQLAVGYDALLGEAVNLGQRDVPIAQLNFRHPGTSGTSMIQLSEITLRFVDGSTMPVPFGHLFDEVKIMRQQTTVGSISLLPPESTSVTITFNAPLILSPGERDSLRVVASIRDHVQAPEFAMYITDSTAFVVRDQSSGSELMAATDTTGLATGASIFPIVTGLAQFRQPAGAPTLCLDAVIPQSTVGGVDSLHLYDLTLSYPYDPNYSGVRLSTIAVSVLDSMGSPLDPNRLFDRIGCRVDNGSDYYQTFVDLLSGAAVFHLSDTGVVLLPGQTRVIHLLADLEADVPFDHFVLQIASENSLAVQDVTDPAHQPQLAADGGCAVTFPFSTAVTEVLFPAGRPTFIPATRPVQVVHAGQIGVPLLEAAVNYPSTTPLGALGLDGLSGRLVRNTGVSGNSTVAAAVIADMRLLINGEPTPGQMTLNGDSVSLVFDQSYRVSRNDELSLQLVVDIADNVPIGNYYLQFDDSTFLRVRDINTAATVYTGMNGAVYPLQSTELSVAATGLEASFSNYPNPFNPNTDGHTTITYVLDRDAEVDIEIFDITGQAVSEVAMKAVRTAGSHQEDIWEGANGVGRRVIPGTYFCRITARYTTGEEETFRRKIAVVR